MFTRADEAELAAAPAPEPASEPEPDAAGEPPSSRGWTMFMEPGAAAAAAQAAGVAPSPGSSSPTPAATPAAEAGAPAEGQGQQRRGWTMFMEAPIDAAAAKPFGPAGAEPAQPPPPEPAAEASSDNRGWTVFGTPSPVSGGTVQTPAAAPTPAATAADPSTSRTVLVTPQPQPQVVATTHDASESPTASGSVTASSEPEPAPGRGRTIVATGVQATPGNVGGVTGRTVFPSTGNGQAMPDTSYFRRGDIQPERPAHRTTAVDVPAPPRAPAEERPQGASRPGSSNAPVPAATNAPVVRSGGRTVWLVVGGIAIVGAIVAIVLMNT
ncbi:MAG: hypothetical protein U0168_32110 [Nannocystaceae bacterium]